MKATEKNAGTASSKVQWLSISLKRRGVEAREQNYFDGLLR